MNPWAGRDVMHGMMNVASAQPLPVGLRNRFIRVRRPPWRRLLVVTLALAILLGTSTLGSTVAHLALPPTTGDHAVGRVATVIVDPARGEAATSDAGDRRAVRLVAWYPPEVDTGEPAAYIEG